MKIHVCTAAGMLGSFLAYLLGGWDEALITLIIFMTIDYITGLMVAGVFKKSRKTETGGLESNAGFKGLCRKCMILLFVLIGVKLDLVLGIDYIRNTVIIAFMTNELISIVENAGLMGLPIPKVIIDAIDVLKKKEGEVND